MNKSLSAKPLVLKLFLFPFVFSFLTFFCFWWILHASGVNTLPIQSEDAVPAMFMPVTLLKHGTLYADQYYDMMLERYPHPDDKDRALGLVPFYLVAVKPPAGFVYCSLPSPGMQPMSSIATPCVPRHYITAFTLTPGLLATPIYAPAILAGASITWENLIILSHLSASAIMAVCGVLMYILLRKHFLTQQHQEKKVLFLTSIYLFATVNFAMLSQALWQHGTLQLFTLAGIIFLLNGLKTQKSMHFVLFGLFLSLAVLTRPTAALFAFLLFLLIPLAFKKNLLKPTLFILLGILPSAIFFIWVTLSFYGGFANNGYVSQMGDSWVSPILEGFLGIWISPSKGILVYSPVLVFSLIGAYRAFKDKTVEHRTFYLLSIVIIFLHTLIMGKWKHWYGGFSFGYRLASDVLPFFILLLVPYVTSSLYLRLKKLFYALLIFSVLVQIMGMGFFDGIWHNAYDDGYRDTRWLWSIRDSEAVFNFRRVLVKMGYLERACPECLPN